MSRTPQPLAAGRWYLAGVRWPAVAPSELVIVTRLNAVGLLAVVRHTDDKSTIYISSHKGAYDDIFLNTMRDMGALTAYIDPLPVNSFTSVLLDLKASGQTTTAAVSNSIRTVSPRGWALLPIVAVGGIVAAVTYRISLK